MKLILTKEIDCRSTASKTDVKNKLG